MSVLTELATALNRKDEIANVALAEDIVKKNDKSAVRELVANLSNPDKNIQSDCIKVLYETCSIHCAPLRRIRRLRHCAGRPSRTT
jgi:hypothetical protein